jgi:hypothetical protein
VTGKVKHHTTLVCVNAGRESLCPLIVTSDRSTLGVFRDGVEENISLEVHGGRSASVDSIIFHDCLRDVLIPRIEDFREANGFPMSAVILFMEECSCHFADQVTGFLSAHRINIIPFPPHSSGLFQMLDLVFFSVLKSQKKHLTKAACVPATGGHAIRTFKGCEAAGASTTVRGSFVRPYLSITRVQRMAMSLVSMEIGFGIRTNFGKCGSLILPLKR